MTCDSLRRTLFASVATLLLLPADGSPAQQANALAAGPAAAAGDIANFFGQVGDQIYEDCIFELSQEQLEVQQALIEAYVKQGATHSLARQLAVKQIHPPKLSDECERIKNSSKSARLGPTTTPSVPKVPGQSFKDCPDCPEMVVVPAGNFMMGSPASEEGRSDNEGPQRKVTIAQPFAVGK